ncbi:MAG: protein kinase [Acidobacteriota bacterium]
MIGRVISHYRITSQLGVGSMGEVYLAEDTRLLRKVALKIFRAEFIHDEFRLHQFQQEARTASALSHPNILTIYDIGQEQENLFIAAELIEGQTLRTVMDAGQLSLTRTLDVARQIGRALSAAHAAGIVHRDLKPDNVMLRSDGLVKILDFGLAGLFEMQAATADARFTNSPEGETEIRMLAGTANYMSPEQAQGKPLDARSDIFSFGVVLYEMLSGRKPFEGANFAGVLKAVLQQDPPPLSSLQKTIPLQLEAIIRRALEKKADDRYPAIARMIDDLQQVQADLLQDNHAHGFQLPAATNESDAQVAAKKLTNLQNFSRRYRKIFLASGVITALLFLCLMLLARPQSYSRFTQAALLLISLGCFAIYFIAREKARTRFTALPKGAAFRGLLPFQEADSQRFYGREIETLALFEMVAHRDFRFGVLFGESGCGKTSLLQAGVVRKLWDTGYVPIYSRAYKEPLAAILDECKKRSRLAIGDSETPTDYVQRVAREMNGCLILICDQFEEFFVNFKTPEEREPFIRFISECHNRKRLPVKVLISMRSDFLYFINAEFARFIAEPLLSAKLYHLRTFNEEQAATVIERSAAIANLPFEKSLIKQVAHDLTDAGAVLPSELQIVGEQLQTKRIFSLGAYRQVGGKETLVYSFLEDVIQASGDKEAAQLLLRCLISDENTRLTLTLDEISHRLQRSKETVRQLLNLFAESRLIRELQDDVPWRYELMHEYLIEKINQVTGKVMDATQRANRLLRQYLASYTVDKSTRIPLRNLLFIRRYAEQTTGGRMNELLSKSLWRGVMQLSLVVLIMATTAVFVAAMFSISEDWQSRRLADGHTAAVRQATFSPDGRWLVSCSEDQQVIVWDFAKRQRLAAFADHQSFITAVAFSSDGKWIATASLDNRVVVRDTKSLNRAFVLSGHTGGVHSLAFSSDGRYLVSAGNEIISWKVGDFEKVGEIAAGLSGTPAFLPHSSRFNLTTENGKLIFVDASTGKTTTRQIAGLRQGVAAISPDGKLRIIIDGEGQVQFADIEQGKAFNTFVAHKDNGRSVAFSPDSKLAASASENVVLWDALRQTKIATLEYDSLVWSVTFSPDGRFLVSTHGDGAIVVWDVAERQRIANLNEHSATIYSVAYSPDGERIASTGEDSSIIIWNAETGQKDAVLMGYQSKINGVAFLPDNQQVISCGFQEPCFLWDIKQGAVTRTFASPVPMSGSNGFAVSADGRWLASSHGVFDIQDGQLRCAFDEKFNHDTDNQWLAQPSQLYGLDFSKDGRLLACSGVINGNLGLLDTANWQVIEHIQAPETPFISLSFSPDGKFLASGDDFGKVELWSVTPLKRLAVLGRHAARVKSVDFSPDGKEIVSASDDKTIALWNVGSRSLERRIGAPAAPIRAVAFSPDGKHIVSGGHDKSVRVYTRHRKLWGYTLE